MEAVLTGGALGLPESRDAGRYVKDQFLRSVLCYSLLCLAFPCLAYERGGLDALACLEPGFPPGLRGALSKALRPWTALAWCLVSFHVRILTDWDRDARRFFFHG